MARLPNEPFYWTIERLSVDGYDGDVRRWKNYRRDEVLGAGLYAVLRAHLRARMLPKGQRAQPIETWVVPRAILLQREPTREDLERWSRVGRLRMSCTNCAPSTVASLAALMLEAGPPASNRRL